MTNAIGTANGLDDCADEEGMHRGADKFGHSHSSYDLVLHCNMIAIRKYSCSLLEMFRIHNYSFA